MLELEMNPYYKRLSKLMLWPIVALVGLVFVMLISHVLILYLIYIPTILTPIAQHLSPEQLVFMSESIEKIIENLSLWLFILMTANILLIYVILNVKKFLADLEGERNNKEKKRGQT